MELEDNGSTVLKITTPTAFEAALLVSVSAQHPRYSSAFQHKKLDTAVNINYGINYVHCTGLRRTIGTVAGLFQMSNFSCAESNAN